ncbi:N-acetylmuramoyl-L-alanine amidase [Planomonospora sp. ID82291]|uniref:N-acetylmuramoyl-L-alanine amidase n=1 Tax=Planomonospora sp. ID82291 TaxID=2738136 RepID=UPI0018C36D91|nr:N-acetylmuramoyl-L-alanine amidase [Planomonospora sp. ID82291]MBG0817123.1 N-acetylmuramoyl-L-alanine amidase [Planomonospora sp. ID82291]
MRRLPWTTVVALAVLAALGPPPAHAVPEAGAGPGGQAAFAVREAGAGPGRQAAFARAARTYGVPENVLLAVSYLQSRWDAHGGRPSVSGGYGPMHLTDARATAPRADQHGARHGDHGGAAGGDPRGDEARPLHVTASRPAVRGGQAPPQDTLLRAARLTGISPDRLRRDPAANVMGGAALLADHHRSTGGRPDAGPAHWYDAVARYPGSRDARAAAVFADEVYAILRTGAARVTDDGEPMTLRADPALAPARRAGRDGGTPRRLALLPEARGRTGPDCPREVSCEWIPAAYRRLGRGRYGNHDRYEGRREIDYIVVHDGETGYDAMTRLAADPAYLSWHFTLRSSDGHIAQHLRGQDVGWHAGNWYVNSRSIGLEHEGYLAHGGAWYTEAMYRASARLVRHLARRYGVPLDRAHILGHDNVPGATPATVRGMHEDPGPYWDWEHYFDLLGRPLDRTARAPRPALAALSALSARRAAPSVTILPRYAAHRPPFTGCGGGSRACPPAGASSVWLHTAPAAGAPLVRDVGKHPTGDSSRSVYDHAARASTGQRYALAERRGDWTAIWYLGQKAWFHDPAGARTSVRARGPVVTPRPGLASVRLYGRPYPEASAYPRGVAPQRPVPLQYRLPAGQRYSLGLTRRGSHLRAVTFDPAKHRLIRGARRYHQIQFGHRVMFVRAEDVVRVQGR